MAKITYCPSCGKRTCIPSGDGRWARCVRCGTRVLARKLLSRQEEVAQEVTETQVCAQCHGRFTLDQLLDVAGQLICQSCHAGGGSAAHLAPLSLKDDLPAAPPVQGGYRRRTPAAGGGLTGQLIVILLVLILVGVGITLGLYMTTRNWDEQNRATITSLASEARAMQRAGLNDEAMVRCRALLELVSGREIRSPDLRAAVSDVEAIQRVLIEQKLSAFPPRQPLPKPADDRGIAPPRPPMRPPATTPGEPSPATTDHEVPPPATLPTAPKPPRDSIFERSTSSPATGHR